MDSSTRIEVAEVVVVVVVKRFIKFRSGFQLTPFAAVAICASMNMIQHYYMH